MNNWNKVGKIKAALMLVLFIVIIVSPLPQGPNVSLLYIFFPFISGIIMGYLAIQMHVKQHQQKLVKPSWNDNPFPKPNNPFSSMIFSVVMILVVGIAMLTKVYFKYEAIDGFGVFAICGGSGMYVGLKFAMKKHLEE